MRSSPAALAQRCGTLPIVSVNRAPVAQWIISSDFGLSRPMPVAPSMGGGAKLTESSAVIAAACPLCLAPTFRRGDPRAHRGRRGAVRPHLLPMLMRAHPGAREPSAERPAWDPGSRTSSLSAARRAARHLAAGRPRRRAATVPPCSWRGCVRRPRMDIDPIQSDTGRTEHSGCSVTASAVTDDVDDQAAQP